MANSSTAETCENCGREIGKLETAHVLGNHIVCGVCKRKLGKSYSVSSKMIVGVTLAALIAGGGASWYFLRSAVKLPAQMSKLPTELPAATQVIAANIPSRLATIPSPMVTPASIPAHIAKNIIPTKPVAYEGGNLAIEEAKLAKSIATLFPYVKPDQLVGKKFLIAPNSVYGKTPNANFLSLTNIDDSLDSPIYKNVVGKVCTYIAKSTSGSRAVIQIDGDKQKYEVFCFEGVPDGLYLESDVQRAKQRWAGKQLWLRRGQVLADEKDGEFWILKNSRVTVVDVQYGLFRPERFVFDTPDGRRGFVECDVSGSASSELLRDIESFQESFFESDPRIFCPYPPEVWKMLEQGTISIGMNAEEVVLSWGHPNSIKTTVTAGGRSEQWIFQHNAFVYLQNGAVTTIQN